MSDRRRHERLPSSARVWWAPIDEDAVQLDRLRDISSSGAWIETEALAHRGTLVTLTIVADDETELASGCARVIWADPIRGLGVEFVDLQVAPETVAAKAPPPLPGGAVKPPPMPVRSREPSVEHAPLVELLSTRAAGVVIGIDNLQIAQIARLAGAPKVKGAGLDLMCQLGETVRAGQLLYRIHADYPSDLEFARHAVARHSGVSLGTVAQMPQVFVES